MEERARLVVGGRTRLVHVCVCVASQVNDWVNKRVVEKFTPLMEKPESVRQDLEKLQTEVSLSHTHSSRATRRSRRCLC